MQLVTPSWLEMFDWPLLRGDIKTALDGPRKAVLTESTAKKYFGDEDPLGKYMKFGDRQFLITGITKDVPKNSHITFSILSCFFFSVSISRYSSDPIV